MRLDETAGYQPRVDYRSARAGEEKLIQSKGAVMSEDDSGGDGFGFIWVRNEHTPRAVASV